jgi:hypothetical protein
VEELLLDPVPIQDIRDVEDPLDDDRHWTAILAAFSSSEGNG